MQPDPRAPTSPAATARLEDPLGSAQQPPGARWRGSAFDAVTTRRPQACVAPGFAVRRRTARGVGVAGRRTKPLPWPESSAVPDRTPTAAQSLLGGGAPVVGDRGRPTHAQGTVTGRTGYQVGPATPGVYPAACSRAASGCPSGPRAAGNDDPQVSGTHAGTGPRPASISTPMTSCGDHRRPALPRRPERGPAAHAAAGFRGPRTASASRAAGAPGAAAPAPARALERYDLGGVYDDIAAEPRESSTWSARGSTTLQRRGRESGDQRRQEITDQVAAEEHLTARPAAARPRRQGPASCSSTSSRRREARQQFEELMDS